MTRTTVALTPDAPGALVTKFIVCSVLGKDSDLSAETIAAERVRGFPQLAEWFRTKNAIGAGGLLATAPYVGGDFYAALASDLELQLTPLVHTVPFRVNIPVEAAAGAAAAWVGQGLPIPSLRTTTATITVDYSKLAAAVAMTAELARFGRVSEGAMLRIVKAAWDKALTINLLDPTIGATINRPASLTFGCRTVVSSGSTAAQIVTDLTAMLAAIQSPGMALRWILRPLTFYKIAAALGGVGLNVSPTNLLGIPCLLASNSPKQITLLDCAAVAWASDESMDLNVTSQATIEMNDAPQQSGISGTGAAMVSTFQAGLIAVKIDSGVSWRHLYYGLGSPSVPQGCVYMPVSF
jgi:hypothetical protein